MPPDLTGQILGDYILQKKLTSGGMAHIYIGEDRNLGRKAAIKVLTSEIFENDESLRERFDREAKAIAQLEHDSIVPIYQYGVDQDRYFLAMRYIEGNDLSAEIKQYKQEGKLMPVDRALDILKQIASALDYAHSNGIIHRDIKPSNVLIGEGDKAILTDFGLVLRQSVDQTLGTAFGTPRYISPEQATDSMSVVPQSDIYSLAVIMYEVVTGEVLFKGNTPMEVALAHITETPTPPRSINPDVPRDAQIEIMKALQKEPEKRHSSALEFIRSLEHAYGIEPTPTDARRSTATMAMLSEAARDDLNDSAEQKLASWDSSPATTVIVPQETNKWMIPAIVGSVIGVILIGVLFTMLTGNDNDLPVSNSATDAPPADVVVPVAPVDGLTLQYNDRFFAIRNNSEEDTVNISAMTFEADDSGAGELETLRVNSLEPLECIFIKRDGAQDSNIPDDWNCDGTARLIQNEPLFWVADGDNASSDEAFRIFIAGDAVERCETVGTAVVRNDSNCQVNWD